jgi:hypothetical protein
MDMLQQISVLGFLSFPERHSAQKYIYAHQTGGHNGNSTFIRR